MLAKAYDSGKFARLQVRPGSDLTSEFVLRGQPAEVDTVSGFYNMADATCNGPRSNTPRAGSMPFYAWVLLLTLPSLWGIHGHSPRPLVLAVWFPHRIWIRFGLCSLEPSSEGSS